VRSRAKIGFIVILSAGMLATTARGQMNQDSTGQASGAAAQAPDDATKRLSELVHAGRYAEAQQTVGALLLLYPEDQRLIKAKALLDKSAAATPATSVVASNSATSRPDASAGTAGNAAVAVKNAADSLTGMDKVDYNALLELARGAQQTTDAQQQRALLQKFLDQSGPFLQQHPEQLLLWQLRATAAMNLNSAKAGREAGRKLLEMGGADSSDASLVALLAQLKNKGWLEAKSAEANEREEQAADSLGWLTGTWEVTWSWSIKSKYEGQHSRGQEMFVISDTGVEGYGLRTGGLRGATADLRARVSGQQVTWECYLPASDTEDLFVYRAHWPLGSSSFYTIGRTLDGEWEKKRTFYPNGWTPILSWKVDNDKRRMTLVIPSQNLKSDPNKHEKDPVTLVLTKVNDETN
jgi:hypothetical protein